MTTTTFSLDPQLSADTLYLGNFKLCALLLMNDKQYPWFILVPRLPNKREIHELDRDDLISYQIESNIVAKMIMAQFKPDKLNIAVIGNIVPQLHIHHIARYKNDASWPKPVWGQRAPVSYSSTEGDMIQVKVKDHLGSLLKY